MIKFLLSLWKKYKKEIALEKADKDINNMITEMKTMTSKDMEDKWKNPSAVFARLQWAKICIKNDLKKCKKCRRYYKEGFSCKCKDITEKYGIEV